jgi:hypothetical protein
MNATWSNDGRYPAGRPRGRDAGATAVRPPQGVGLGLWRAIAPGPTQRRAQSSLEGFFNLVYAPKPFGKTPLSRAQTGIAGWALLVFHLCIGPSPPRVGPHLPPLPVRAALQRTLSIGR